MKQEAPLFRDCARLTSWLLNHYKADHGPVARRISELGLLLLEDVGVALARAAARGAALESADETLLRLRIHVRLSHSCGQLSDEQLLFLADEMGGIGRQLGGWLRKLGPV